MRRAANTHWTWRVALFGAMSVVLTAPCAMADPSSPSACFAPNDLKAVAGENLVKHHEHDFDADGPDAALLPVEPVAAALRGAIRRVTLPNGEKLIALTFDLCETQGEIAGYDGAIFDYLRSEHVKATLFAGGKWMRSHAARTAQLMLDPLFEIANHSETHRNLRTVAPEIAKREILGPQRAYEAARAKLAATQCAGPSARSLASLPPRLRLFRFPFGACNAASLAAVNDAGLLAIQWDVSTGDPAKGQSAAAIANAMVRQSKPGSIVISHANGRGWHTAEALPLAIPKLKALGYTFVTVSELLARGKPVMAQACYNVRPGDTDRYDFLFARPAGDKAGAGTALAAASPWSVYQMSPDALASYFVADEADAPRYAIFVGEQLAGAVGLRLNWLRGPYLQFLGVTPAHQGQGIGRLIVTWFELTARTIGDRNIWVAASDFNADALRFYERCGFKRVAALADLIRDGKNEILLRKALSTPSA